MSASSLTISPRVAMNVDVQPRDHVQSAFDRCGAALYRFFIVRTSGNAHQADDFMQQLWLQLTRCGKSVPAGEVEFWLRTVARNLIRAHWRQKSRRPTDVPFADASLAQDLARRLSNELVPLDLLERKETRDLLLLALTELNAEEQELLIEHYFHGRSHADLANDLGISERAVEGRMYRARQSLRARLMNIET